MTKRKATAILMSSVLCVAPYTWAGEPTVKERAIGLLRPIGKSEMTENEAKEVASLGPGVLPVVYDALFSTNDFGKGNSEAYALRVLAHTRDTNAIPKIKEYVARDARLCWRFEALRAVLEIANTDETRKYVAEMCTHWMTHPEYRHDVEFGFCRLLDASIPSTDLVGIVNRTALNKFIFRAQVFRHLGLRADDVSIPVLRHFLATGDAELVLLVNDSIGDALRQLQDEATRYSTVDNFAGSQQPMTKQEMDRRRAEILARVARLKTEFPKRHGTTQRPTIEASVNLTRDVPESRNSHKAGSNSAAS